jgi:HEAT repeat protein
LAEIGELDDPAPLERLLANRDATVRLAAAIALTRLGRETGFAALERLAYHGDPRVRCQVAEAMGTTKYVGFVPTLVRLLDDRLAVRHAALTSLQAIVPEPVIDRHSDETHANAPSLDRLVAKWKQWYATNGAVSEAGKN